MWKLTPKHWIAAALPAVMVFTCLPKPLLAATPLQSPSTFPSVKLPAAPQRPRQRPRVEPTVVYPGLTMSVSQSGRPYNAELEVTISITNTSAATVAFKPVGDCRLIITTAPISIWPELPRDRPGHPFTSPTLLMLSEQRLLQYFEVVNVYKVSGAKYTREDPERLILRSREACEIRLAIVRPPEYYKDLTGDVVTKLREPYAWPAGSYQVAIIISGRVIEHETQERREESRRYPMLDVVMLSGDALLNIP